MTRPLTHTGTHTYKYMGRDFKHRTHEKSMFHSRLEENWVALLAQLVKNSPAVWENWVRSLGWEDPLEDSSVLAGRIPRSGGAWEATVHGVLKSQAGLSH